MTDAQQASEPDPRSDPPADTAMTEPLPPEATAILVDSSAIVALVDSDDAAHAAMVEAYRQLVEEGYRLFTTNYVIAETHDLLIAGVGPAIARQWLRASKLAVYHADEQDARRAQREVIRSKSARGLSVTDAVSLVVMERLNVVDALAADPSFLAGTS